MPVAPAASPGCRDFCETSTGEVVVSAIGSPGLEAGRVVMAAVNSHREGFPTQTHCPQTGTLDFTDGFDIHCAPCGTVDARMLPRREADCQGFRVLVSLCNTL